MLAGAQEQAGSVGTLNPEARFHSGLTGEPPTPSRVRTLSWSRDALVQLSLAPESLQVGCDGKSRRRALQGQHLSFRNFLLGQIHSDFELLRKQLLGLRKWCALDVSREGATGN